ncbi:hypothetical protein VTJ04DRAFT_10374 [Mycothermus thermophilus]|uniref:uncharacterized protein n=1 Tax=Humicola insolens TaxID=85995 RepID=UPI003743A5A9
MPPAPPPPPPPPLPSSFPNVPPPPSISTTTTANPQLTRSQQQALPVPSIPATGPPNTLLLSLLVYNGYPFCDHWEYFISAAPPAPPVAESESTATSPDDESSHPSDVGTILQAKGNVRNGFVLEAKRGWDISRPENRPDRRVRLGWVDRGLLEPVEVSLFGKGLGSGEGDPVVEENCEAICGFEKIVFRVPAPEKTLRDVDVQGVEKRTRVTQRNCQTWILETAELLVEKGVLDRSVIKYLEATKQV